MNLESRIKKLEENQKDTSFCACIENQKALECHSFVDDENGAILGNPISDKCQLCGKTINKTVVQLIDED